METIKQTRRSALQRGLMFVAASCGLQLAPRESEATLGGPPPQGSTTLTLYVDSLHGHRPGQQPGKLPTHDGFLNRRAQLLDQPGGKKLGEFAAASFGPGHPFAGAGRAGASLELETFHLADGSLFGMGCSSDEPKVHAILGGTGRFAGARGSYIVRRTSPATGHSAVEFVITLLT